MKRLHLFLAAVLFIASNSFAQSYGLGNTDPAIFTKYRIPETSLSALWFNTSLSLNTDKQKYSSIPSNYYSQFNYSMAPHYFLLKEDDDTRFNLDANMMGSYQHNYTEQNGEYYSKRNNLNVNIYISGLYNNYFSTNDYFYSFGANLNMNLSDYKEDNPSINYHNWYSGSKTQNYTFSFGIGWGKIRNVTPVVTAIRFQERLKQMNLLNDDMDAKTIVDLAQQFSKSNYYSNVYDRPNKYFWQDIEKTLQKDGVSLSGINQYGMLYLQEAPNDLKFLREEGLETGINTRINYNNNYYSGDVPIQEELFILGNVYFNFSHQLNLNSQFKTSINLYGGPNVIKPTFIKQEYNVDIILEYDYELTDRIVTTLKNEFNLGFLNKPGQDRNTYDSFSFNTNYFVEDHLSLTLSYKLSYIENKNPLYWTNIGTVNSIQFGFSYYIDRGFILP